MISLDQTLDKLRGVLSVEQEQRKINGLVEITGHKIRRNAIQKYLADIEAELEPVRQAIKTFPSLPNESEIQWAQAICAMPVEMVRLLEIESTGLSEQDEMVRLTTVDLTGTVQDDLFFKPSRPMSAEASASNGLTDVMLQYAPPLRDMWELIRAALYGKYVLSFSQQFDRKKLQEAAARHQLPPIVFVGDDLQTHATHYYNGEYSLRLAEVCERVGHPLESNSAIHRARGQCAILKALAEGITDVRPPKKPDAQTSSTSTSTSVDDGLSEQFLDEHPF